MIEGVYDLNSRIAKFTQAVFGLHVFFQCVQFLFQPYFWARGNGWMAVGMAELLLSTPEDNPNHARILEGYRLMMKSLKDYQDKSGMWNQLIDKADCWPETSGSAMFTYAMIMGVKKGWLDAEEM